MSLRKRFVITSIIAVLLVAIAYVWAGITGASSGGTAISADTAASGGTGAWTTLSGPTYAETINGDIASDGHVTLTAPAGFAFNTTNPVSVLLTSGDTRAAANMNEAPVGGNVATTANGSLSVSATTISFYVFSKSRGNTLNTIRWQGIQVRPLQGTPLASGNITLGLPLGSTAPSSSIAGTLSTVPGAVARLHTVLPGQSFAAPTGVSGTASTQTAGTSFTLTRVVATDRFNNVVSSYTGSKTISWSGPSAGCGTAPTYTTSVTFNSGMSATFLTTTLVKAETTSLSASDGTVSGPASSSFSVLPAPLSQLVVTLPGQGFTPCLGVTGAPAQQEAGVAFVIPSITATDRFHNVVTSYAGSKALTYSGPAGAASYTAPVSFSGGQSTSTLTTTITDPQTTTITVREGAVGGPASSSFVVASRAVGSFNAFDKATAAGAVSGVLATKVAAQAFPLDVVAVSGSTVATSFTGTVKVELVDSATPASCAAYPLIQLLPNQTFVAGDNGRRSIAAVTESNAWRSVTVRISHPAGAPTAVHCSSDKFSIRPDRFGLVAATDLNDAAAGTSRALTNTAVPGGVVHKAGQPFTISAVALNAAGVPTANYMHHPDAPQARVQACSVAAVCPASVGTLSIGTWSKSGGTLSTSNASYNEVGAFALVLEDETFAAVDAADSAASERRIASSATHVGRFVPDHFTLVPGAIVPRTDLPACSASSFTYMDEPFSVAFGLVAQSAAPGNTTTRNYEGALATLDAGNPGHLYAGAANSAATATGFAAPISAITAAAPGRVTTATRHGLATGATVFVSGVGGMTEVNNKRFTVAVIDPFNFTINADTTAYAAYTGGGNASRLAVDSSSGAWAAGMASVSATMTLLRSAQPDGPYRNVSIGLAPRDADGVTLSAYNLDADGNGGNERFALGTASFLFGRLVLQNAYGNSLQDLRVPLLAQYWTGASFLLNGQDNCTALGAAGNLKMSNYRGGIGASQVASPASITLGGAIAAGNGRFTLAKPVPAPATKGSVDITLDLGAENKPYLKGRGPTGLYDQNPGSRATFGAAMSGRLIHVRDAY